MNMAYTSTSEEIVTKQFIEKVNAIRQDNHLGPISWNTAVKFLMARKFDVDRALTLYEQHEVTRQREGLARLNPAVDPLRTELTTGKFTVLPCRDSSGAAIAVFTARLHNPTITSHQTTLQGVVYQLDAALRSPETQRSGLVFIYDMTESVYHHFEYALSQKILTLLKGGYPARLKKVLIVTPPLWFRAPFKVLRLFVREKLRDRVYTVTLSELVNHIPPQCLPLGLGGGLEVNHEAWLMRCLDAMEGSGENNTSGSLNGDGHQKGSEEDIEFPDEDLSITSEECTSISRGPSYEDLCSETNESASESDSNERVLRERGVPLDISSREEEENNEVRGIGEENRVNFQSAESNARVNGHEKSDGSPQALASSGSSGFSDDDSLHYSENGGQTLDEFVKYLKKTGRSGLYDEYSMIKNTPPEGTFEHSRNRLNMLKNRYTDVLCLDHSRVELSKENNEEHTTYINGNYVDGYKQKNAFISSQGALPCTFGDNWRMIWEQNCAVVVMTTKTVERGRTKCGQYWPSEQGSSITHSHFSITNTNVRREQDYVISNLSVLDSRSGEERDVEHLQFTSWPDYGVPDSALAMLGFLEKVRESQTRLTKAIKGWTGHNLGPPILVHCSAGIGRTGTLCTLDICLRRLEDIGTIDVRTTVEKIRSQRAFSIQMPDQYVFCHLAILEYALKERKLLEVDLTGFEEEDASDSD